MHRLRDAFSAGRWRYYASAAAAIAALPLAGYYEELAPMTQAVAQKVPAQLPAPPANGELGFVVSFFAPSILPGKDACPEGPALKTRQIFEASLAPDERARLLRPENGKEFDQRWHDTMFRSDGTNLCNQYIAFPDRPLTRTVQSKFSRGMNLDGENGDGSTVADGCAHENFESPEGELGIDNQAYRALGCKLEWRGADGNLSDVTVGLQQFMKSGQWTQVILLRGVDSLQTDDDVEVIYANTPDRPALDSAGNFLPGAGFVISDQAPRYRNVLHGRIIDGVLTTDAKTIMLAQNWGQGGARDIRGRRMRWTLQKGRLRLAFQADGSLKGVVGGYQPLGELIQSTSLAGNAPMVAGTDCAGEYNTLKKLADGMRDPATGKCTAISSSLDISAIRAFVTDLPARSKSKS